MICHRSGLDGHPALQIDPDEMPRPERRPEPIAPARKGAPETRRQKRARLFGAVNKG